ncbi:hypothetical protein DDE18_01420 [Nocardioides gansuensis]|uniref:Spore protein YkvP/CgeB glycosyl transferase-like domain-containing protein n=1 Tax=Nocardioides gansuensis TaxID=2138300 RepID=A0A2T8FF33_9ACTN|nr:glycosyltransferase [Nocardioides gansuensis]PVG84316.1 hypothetical protein DDE18_01420 [Nocardioides gansuensis]
MRVAYHHPFPGTLNAHRVIYNGYKNAFGDLGHEFFTYSAGMDLASFLSRNRPDLFVTASHFLWRKQLDYGVLKRFRDQGMRTLVRVDFWTSPLHAHRVNEARSMSDDSEAVRLIRSGRMGDAFFHVTEQGDPRMEGFARGTGHPYHTIPLAADVTLMRHAPDARFKSDIAFIGTNLPQKREFFRSYLFPLGKTYDLKLYGQDWTRRDRYLGYIQKLGQYLNLPVLRSIRKPRLELEDEARIYSSSRILVNLHEDYQRRFGGDCNERTFKVPACGGFEIADDVACIRNYFDDGDEIVIATGIDDWFDKIRYYSDHPDERTRIAGAGQARVLREHTYHHRAGAMLDLALM